MADSLYTHLQLRAEQATESSREPIGMAPTDEMLARQGRENGSIAVLDASQSIKGIPMWVRRAEESNGLGARNNM